MTPQEIRENPRRFYEWKLWRRLRKEVLASDKHECQVCKARGRYAKANTVHHVNHVKVRPEWALNKTYVDGNGLTQRNLISVCHDCHETVCHPERLRWREIKKPLTEERW